MSFVIHAYHRMQLAQEFGLQFAFCHSVGCDNDINCSVFHPSLNFFSNQLSFFLIGIVWHDLQLGAKDLEFSQPIFKRRSRDNDEMNTLYRFLFQMR